MIDMKKELPMKQLLMRIDTTLLILLSATIILIEFNERNSTFFLAWLLMLVLFLFFAGVLVRIFSPELQITRMGDVLMMVAASGRLFLYVRGLSPSNFFPGNKTRWPLRLIDGSKTPVPAFDEHKRTPTERVISGE